MEARGNFLNQSLPETTAHTLKLPVLSINMDRIWLLYDYALKSCDYVVTDVLWFKDSCILPLTCRLHLNNKMKYFNSKIKDKEAFLQPLNSSLFRSCPHPMCLGFSTHLTGWLCFESFFPGFSCRGEPGSTGFSENYIQAIIVSLTKGLLSGPLFPCPPMVPLLWLTVEDFS